MNYKLIISVNILFLLFSSLFAQKETETRNFIKTVPVSEETSLEISNKYGTVQVTPWDKDSVLIRAEVKAYAPNHSRLDKMFDGVNININDSKYLVKAETDFTQSISMLFESFKGMTSKLISYDSRVEINYYVKAPEYITLGIDNKYGDVYMEKTTGKCSVSVSNGSFKANSLGSGTSLTFTFCNATINSVQSGKINANFSDITIGETGDIFINSISSRFDIKNAGSVKVDSRKDKLYLGKTDKLTGTSYFTDYNVQSLSGAIDLSTKYGSINTDLVEKNFESVDITSNYTDVNLAFDKVSSYSLEIRQTNSFVVLPDKIAKTEKKSLNDDRKEYIIYGTVGSNPGNRKVRIDATRGNIYLK
ncbi:MAG TPA: hypothetical protein VJ963_12365 [Bacteroidales bacterium]|nr:hypothetical protein [Bacteroidales bacterium]